MSALTESSVYSIKFSVYRKLVISPSTLCWKIQKRRDTWFTVFFIVRQK